MKKRSLLSRLREMGRDFLAMEKVLAEIRAVYPPGNYHVGPMRRRVAILGARLIFRRMVEGQTIAGLEREQDNWERDMEAKYSRPSKEN